MNIIALIAEKKIQAAVADGEFANLPGHGKPLPAEQTIQVPDHLRVGFKILQNAGVLPVEMELRHELTKLQDQLANCGEEQERLRLQKSINDASAKYRMLMEKHLRRAPRP